MPQTILVANGPISGLGYKIDKFDTVIRMHHGDISAFKKDVGEKMDIWVTPMGLVRPWMTIPVPHDLDRAAEIWTFNQERGNSGPNHFWRARYGMKVIECGKDFRYEIYQHYSRNAHPTKGYFALKYALKRFKEVYIAGFSFYRTKEAWFWDKKDREMPSVYDIPFEKAEIEELVKDGRVKWLKK